MRKLIVMWLVALVVGGFAIAGNGNGMGAVKTGLYERQGGEGPADPGSGVKTSGPYSGVLVGTVEVNHMGKGQAQFSQEVGVAEEKGETVPVQVVVKQGGGGEIVGATTATVDVPLKLMCEEDI